MFKCDNCHGEIGHAPYCNQQHNPTKHKWHKEIKAWADGASIQYRLKNNEVCFLGEWTDTVTPYFNIYPEYEYRIKPTIKTFTKYVNVYNTGIGAGLYQTKEEATLCGKAIGGYIKTIEITTEIEV